MNVNKFAHLNSNGNLKVQTHITGFISPALIVYAREGCVCVCVFYDRRKRKGRFAHRRKRPSQFSRYGFALHLLQHARSCKRQPLVLFPNRLITLNSSRVHLRVSIRSSDRATPPLTRSLTFSCRPLSVLSRMFVACRVSRTLTLKNLNLASRHVTIFPGKFHIREQRASACTARIVPAR